MSRKTRCRCGRRADGKRAVRRPPGIEAIDGVIRAEIERLEADLAIVADGSGPSARGGPPGSGWAAAVLVPARRRPIGVLYGAQNFGPSMMAELLPFLHALSWYELRRGPAKRRRLGRPLRAACLTDCESLVACGSGLAEHGRQPIWCGPYWAALSGMADAGYDLRWVRVDRAGTALNRYCDELAGAARRALHRLDET